MTGETGDRYRGAFSYQRGEQTPPPIGEVTSPRDFRRPDGGITGGVSSLQSSGPDDAPVEPDAPSSGDLSLSKLAQMFRDLRNLQGIDLVDAAKFADIGASKLVRIEQQEIVPSRPVMFTLLLTLYRTAHEKSEFEEELKFARAILDGDEEEYAEIAEAWELQTVPPPGGRKTSGRAGGSADFQGDGAAVSHQGRAVRPGDLGIRGNPQLTEEESPANTDSSSGDDRPLIFLCHSSGDKERVRQLYQRLTGDGVRCWFDEEDLLPGQDWELEIRKAMKASRYVLVCVSNASLTKTGYIQKELRSALDLADEQPPGSIFLIPAMLEPCLIPDHMSKWQFVRLYEEAGYPRLLRSLMVSAPKAENPLTVTPNPVF